MIIRRSKDRQDPKTPSEAKASTIEVARICNPCEDRPTCCRGYSSTISKMIKRFPWQHKCASSASPDNGFLSEPGFLGWKDGQDKLNKDFQNTIS